MRWLWAAYEMGMWRENFSGHLSQDAFQQRFYELAGNAAHDWILEAQGDDGLQPVGLILAQNLGTGIEPLVEWFPWATNRNQIEATAVFLKEISKQFKIFVFAGEDTIKFWSLFKRNGMVRQGCKVIDYFSRGEHAMLFYTVSK